MSTGPRLAETRPQINQNQNLDSSLLVRIQISCASGRVSGLGTLSPPGGARGGPSQTCSHGDRWPGRKSSILGVQTVPSNGGNAHWKRWWGFGPPPPTFSSPKTSGRPRPAAARVRNWVIKHIRAAQTCGSLESKTSGRLGPAADRVRNWAIKNIRAGRIIRETVACPGDPLLTPCRNPAVKGPLNILDGILRYWLKSWI